MENKDACPLFLTQMENKDACPLFLTQGAKYTNYVEIDVSGLNVVQGRAGVYVIPNEGPLNLAGRIISSGKN